MTWRKQQVSLPAQTASQSAFLDGANSKSIPHGANSKCYLESLDQEGGWLGRIEIEVGVEAQAAPCSLPGEAYVTNAVALSGGDGEQPEALSDPNPGKAPYNRCGFRVVTPLGDRVCGMLAPAGSDLCVDHSWRAQR